MTSLFRTSAPPPVAAAAPMPAAASPAVLEAQKTATAAALARGGRASTIQGKQGAGGPSRAPVATAADSFGGRSLGSAAP